MRYVKNWTLRTPDANETPLSAAEIEIAVKLKLIDPDDEIDLWPIKRCYVPSGCWGIRRKGLRYAHPFDGLMA